MGEKRGNEALWHNNRFQQKKKIKKSYAPSLFLLKCLVTGVDPKDLRGGKPAEEGRQLAIFSIEQWKKTHLNQLAVIFFLLVLRSRCTVTSPTGCRR